MSRPQRPRRATEPVTPTSYRVIAGSIRVMADELEACAEKPDHKTAASTVVHGLLTYLNRVANRLKL